MRTFVRSASFSFAAYISMRREILMWKWIKKDQDIQSHILMECWQLVLCVVHVCCVCLCVGLANLPNNFYVSRNLVKIMRELIWKNERKKKRKSDRQRQRNTILAANVGDVMLLLHGQRSFENYESHNIYIVL